MKRFAGIFVIIVALFSVFAVSAQDEELPTIAEIVVASTEAEEPEFTTLLAAVGLAEEFVLEALADPEEELTVLAPTDAAFEALAEALGEEAFADVLADTEFLTDVLLYHVIDGIVYSDDVEFLLEDMDGEIEVEMLNGAVAFVTADDMGIYIDDAEIIIVDIVANNGVIHVIDAVIIPMAEEDEE